MPEGQYLIRFDDICPTMDWRVWDELEGHLLRLGIRPILAVVPDNQDPSLQVASPRADFWARVREWQARGWTIALHGYQHTYVNAEAGILGLNPRSEFAGLGFEAQLEKLARGLEIFAGEGVRAEAWVAPSHSFDWETVRALGALGLRTISDGFAFRPYRTGDGMTWVPQQLATPRRMPFGIWTFCCHLNGMKAAQLAAFIQRLERLAPRMISLPEAAALGTRPRTLADRGVGVARALLSLRHRAD